MNRRWIVIFLLCIFLLAMLILGVGIMFPMSGSSQSSNQALPTRTSDTRYLIATVRPPSVIPATYTPLPTDQLTGSTPMEFGWTREFTYVPDGSLLRITWTEAIQDQDSLILILQIEGYGGLIPRRSRESFTCHAPYSSCGTEISVQHRSQGYGWSWLADDVVRIDIRLDTSAGKFFLRYWENQLLPVE